MNCLSPWKCIRLPFLISWIHPILCWLTQRGCPPLLQLRSFSITFPPTSSLHKHYHSELLQPISWISLPLILDLYQTSLFWIIIRIYLFSSTLTVDSYFWPPPSLGSMQHASLLNHLIQKISNIFYGFNPWIVPPPLPRGRFCESLILPNDRRTQKNIRG